MESISLEQALFRRQGDGDPELSGRSAGFGDAWLEEARELMLGFGDRPPGVACPHAVFAQPYLERWVALVQVADQGAEVLGFRFLIVDRKVYEQFLGDPFRVAARLPADWQARGDLPTLHWPDGPLPKRTVAEVCRVLAKVKGQPLPEDVEPTLELAERSAATAESPALLGGVQVLVDGGRLLFQRDKPDPGLIEGLWTLLPGSTRSRLWPASFAFSNALEFDAVVLPRMIEWQDDDYTNEAQALNYPEGYYELNLQIAAESGNQRQLDALLERRSGRETIRLALILLIVLMSLMLAPRLLELLPRGPAPDPERAQQLATAASMVGTGNPLGALGVYLHGKTRWGKR